MFVIYPEKFKMRYLRYISLLLVVSGELLLKEALLFRELAMLLTHRKDGDVFLNIMSQKKKVEPTILKFAYWFDNVIVFHVKLLFCVTSAIGAIIAL